MTVDIHHPCYCAEPDPDEQLICVSCAGHTACVDRPPEAVFGDCHDIATGECCARNCPVTERDLARSELVEARARLRRFSGAFVEHCDDPASVRALAAGMEAFARRDQDDDGQKKTGKT